MFRYVHKIGDPALVLKGAPMGFVEIPPSAVPSGFVVAELSDGGEMPEYRLYEDTTTVDTNALYDAFGTYFANNKNDDFLRQHWVTIDELLTLTTIAGYKINPVAFTQVEHFLEATLNKFDTATTDDLFDVIDKFAPS